MTFDNGEFLWYLVGIPVIGVFLLISSLRTRRAVSALTTTRQEARVSAVLTVKTFVTAILFAGTLASLVLALAGPRWGEVSVEDERRGLELVFLFDVSNSMSAQDIQQSRLERSRETARSIVSRVPEAFVATVAFKGDAVPIVPMTEDDVAFELALSNLTGSLLTAPGTNIERGLNEALRAFPSGSGRYRAIILFSDGEQLEGSIDGVLEEIRLAEVPVIVVAAGTEGGAVIPTVDGGVVRDGSGNPVITRIDAEALDRIATSTNGSLYRLSDRSLVQEIVTELDRRSGVGRQVVFRRTRVERYHVFVLLALLFLVLLVLVHGVRWREVV